MPFPDIALYGKGYSTNIRDSIRAYKHPIVSTKTQAQLNAVIASNVASHRIKWSEAEVHRAVKNRVDDADDVGLPDSVGDAEADDDDASVDDTATFGEEDADVASVNEETTAVHEATPQEKAATSEEKANALFTAAGYTENSIPKDEKELREFFKRMRDEGILTNIKYSTKSTPEKSRRRLLTMLGVTETAPTHFTSVAPPPS